MAISLLVGGALLGAAAGGTVGYTAAGLTGAGLGIGVGALAGLGVGAAICGFTTLPYYCAPPFPLNYAQFQPVFYPSRMYYTTAI